MVLAGVAAVGALAACSPAPSCGPSSALVDHTIDGDTIVLENGDKVRYLMVNAPETTNGHDDCYGSNAATFNHDLVAGKTVELVYDTECKDKYDRWLAYVSIGGQEVNTLLVDRGYACVLHIAPNGDDRLDEFNDLQTEARQAHRGLWGTCDPIPCN